MNSLYRFAILFIFATGALTGGALHAAPFASNVAVSGTSVSFILNEPADTLFYRVNFGPLQPLNGATKGTKNFSLNAAGDKFSIVVGKTAAVGYSIPTGGTITAVASGLSQNTAEGGFNLISDDSNPLTRFNSPRGVAVSNDPNAPKFGSAYVANSAASAVAVGPRASTGDGLYAIHADQSDAFGYGNTASDPGNKFDSVAASANSPFRTFVAANGEVYVADFSDANSNVWRNNSNMTVGTQMLGGVGGPTVLPAGQNHGSSTSVHVEGSAAGGDLIIYTVDEDLTTAHVTGSGSTTDRNSLWRYDVNGNALPYSTMPTKVNSTNELIGGATSDLQRGADGKFYLAQNRTVGAEAGVVVLDANGVKLYDSLTASRTLLGNPTANDILRNLMGMAVSEDQKWLAGMVNNSDVVVVPMINGIPDLANRLLVNTGTDVNSGRDIAFDAAGNIHYVSSGQAMYRVLSPGGTTWARTAFDGSSYEFSISENSIPEPATCLLSVLGLIGLLSGVRRR